MSIAYNSTRASHQPGHMGPITSDPPSWPLPQKIAYFKVRYSGAQPPYTFSYSAFGYYDQALSSFLPRLRPNSPNPPGPPDTAITTYGQFNMDFDLGYSCYIVFHLDPTQNWQYRYSDDGIEMNDATPDEYMYLTYVDDLGNTAQGGGTISNPNASPPATPVHIVYFAAKGGSKKGTQTVPVADGFNLYVNIPGLGDCPIDPDIKNTGRPPSGTPLKRRRRRAVEKI